MEIAVLALGCFWGPEIKFGKIDGVIKTEVGYCGGNSPTTTYKRFALAQPIMRKWSNLILTRKLFPMKKF